MEWVSGSIRESDFANAYNANLGISINAGTKSDMRKRMSASQFKNANLTASLMVNKVGHNNTVASSGNKYIRSQSDDSASTGNYLGNSAMYKMQQ
jgi:hypothetical protein